jgi:hypothetical protein
MSASGNGHAPTLVLDALDGLVAPSPGASRRRLDEADWARYEGYVSEILASFGLDLATPGTAATPRRFLRAIWDATEGYDGDRSCSRRSRPSATATRTASWPGVVEGRSVRRAVRAPRPAVHRPRVVGYVAHRPDHRDQ